MPTYITLYEFTVEGVQAIDEMEERLEEAIELGESMGAELQGWYLTMGQYDMVTVAEYPDDETAAQHLLTLAQAGTVSTETLKAFTEEEAMELIAGMPT